MGSIRGIRKTLAGFILLLAATLMLAACGGGGADAGPSAAEISAMVKEAVESAAPEVVSATEIGTLVEAAVSAASEPAVSAAEIESLVTQAVEQAAADAATPLSASEVQAIVSAAIEAIPEPEVIALPTAAPAEEMEVVVVGGTHRSTHNATWNGLEQLDPASPVYWSPAIYMLWDRLVAVDLNTGVALPALATSWESNADATQWTFNIRQGVTHNDGTPLTAADVIYTTQRHMDPDIGSIFAGPLEIVDQDGLEMPDANTVVFNLNSANVDFPVLLTNRNFLIVPDGSGDAILQTPIGTGPFTLTSASLDGVSVFTARDDYWDGSPLLGKITDVGIADADARISATLAGQIDMAGRGSSITAGQAALFEGDPDFYIQESARGGMQTIGMITTEPPFDDVRVRQALKMVVDPDEMIAIVLQGHGTPACNTPSWPNDPYYLPRECPQDIAGAIALLAEAGYPDGLTIELATSNSNAVWIPMATVYKEQAALAGITVEILQVPADGYWSNTWMVHPFANGTWANRGVDQFLSLAFRCGSRWNDTFWCNAEQDAIQDQARAELDFDARRSLYQSVQRTIMEEGGMISPFFPSHIRAMNVRLQGVPGGAVDWEFPYHEFRIVEP